MITLLKIAGLPSSKQYAALPWGRQIEHRHAIAAFKAKAKSMHLSQKRQSYRKAVKDAVELHGIKEYFCTLHNSPGCKDDSFEFWYVN